MDLFEKYFKNQKVDVSKIQDLYTTEPEFTRSNEDIAMEIDDLKVLETALYRQFRLTEVDGMVNILYVLTYPNATTYEIETALVRRTKLRDSFEKICDFFHFINSISELFVRS